MVGYSATPLVQKLGIKSGFRVLTVAAPKNYQSLLAPLPSGVRFLHVPTERLDMIHLFVETKSILQQQFATLPNTLSPTGMLWVSWPKGSSGRQSDVIENDIRKIGFSSGMVDVKVCAIDEVWSGLKFVFRLKDRKPA